MVSNGGSRSHVLRIHSLTPSTRMPAGLNLQRRLGHGRFSRQDVSVVICAVRGPGATWNVDWIALPLCMGVDLRPALSITHSRRPVAMCFQLTVTV